MSSTWCRCTALCGTGLPAASTTSKLIDFMPKAPGGRGTFARLVSLSEPGCPSGASANGPIRKVPTTTSPPPGGAFTIGSHATVAATNRAAAPPTASLITRARRIACPLRSTCHPPAAASGPSAPYPPVAWDAWAEGTGLKLPGDVARLWRASPCRGDTA
jgi:hypothetical protein